MKKALSFLLVLVMVASTSYASDISLEKLWNRVFNSSANTIRATISGNAGSLGNVTCDTISVTSYVSADAQIYWNGGNVTYVPLTGDIEAYVAAATAGDTLVLAAGTYTITDDID
ncbi:MAG: hypothetical protein KKD77_22890, partial [Gammaproteobacteria bacterium]|nr:hypothetical protein [Gammaproteobacteria bacterium]